MNQQQQKHKIVRAIQLCWCGLAEIVIENYKIKKDTLEHFKLF